MHKEGTTYGQFWAGGTLDDYKDAGADNEIMDNLKDDVVNDNAIPQLDA